jgi:PIN domain nuclease of toxin-antitoxin system
VNKGVVLDASALLALLNDEPGADAVRARLDDAMISAVNLSEVFAVLMAIGLAPEEARQTLADLALPVVPFDEDQAFRAARLRETTKALGLSLGDRACLALGEARGDVALTADRAWGQADLSVEIALIR